MIGCLCIHGFTGDPSEVAPLIDHLKQKKNWHFSVPTLPGHGKSLKELKSIEYNEWIEHAENELKKLMDTCDKVYVIGFSMGGLIASYLAVHYPVDKLVLLSAAAFYVSPKQLSKDFFDMLKDAVKGGIHNNELYNRYKRKITETPITATFQFQKLVKKVRPLLRQVNVPTLIAQGECDGIVPPKTAQYVYDHIAAQEKKLIYIKNAKHLICHCHEREQLFAEVEDFLRE